MCSERRLHHLHGCNASLGPKTATTDACDNDAAVANNDEFDSDTDSHLEDEVDDEADTQPPSNAVSLLSDLSLGSDEEEEEDEDAIEEQSHGDLSILSLRVREA